ncbi:putative quinol monooxygenase [Primorskyibacter sp. 2E107]|uniref:putative quinol monooxygenase n=1 Tax=Primorskyibacter sp. 2E107 TaxID=3403458 RepID=UPI003AF7939C
MPVFLSGTLTCPPDRLDAVRASLPLHIALTRDEPGCLRFDVTEDPDQPGLFHVSEEFSDRLAVAARQSRGASSHWASITKGQPRDYAVTGDAD